MNTLSIPVNLTDRHSNGLGQANPGSARARRKARFLAASWLAAALLTFAAPALALNTWIAVDYTPAATYRIEGMLGMPTGRLVQYGETSNLGPIQCIYRFTDDMGASWVDWDISPTSGLTACEVVDLVCDPSGSELSAAVSINDDGNTYIMKSYDDGMSWFNSAILPMEPRCLAFRNYELVVGGTQAGDWIVMRSPDGGFTFSAIDSFKPRFGTAAVNRIRVSDTGDIYAIGHTSVRPDSKVYARSLLRKGIDTGTGSFNFSTLDSCSLHKEGNTVGFDLGFYNGKVFQSLVGFNGSRNRAVIRSDTTGTFKNSLGYNVRKLLPSRLIISPTGVLYHSVINTVNGVNRAQVLESANGITQTLSADIVGDTASLMLGQDGGVYHLSSSSAGNFVSRRN